MDKSKIIIKIVLTVLIIVALSFVCFWLMIIFALTGESFPALLVVISYFIMFALIPLTIFGLLPKKVLRIIWITFFVLLIVISCTYAGIKSYHRNIPKITEWSVDLNEYAPFVADTKLAVLDTVSTLKIDTILPRIDGATALYPLYAAFAQAVYPVNNYYRHNSEVMCNTTRMAYANLTGKEVDIIFAGPPSQQQLEHAAENNVSFILTPIAKEAFVFFVNANNPVESLTVEQIQKIYSGEITNWKEVGGKNEKIRAFQRNESSGSQTAFIKFMEGKIIIEPQQEEIFEEMSGIISQVADYANYSNSIGFSFRYYVNSMVGNDGIKLLKIDDVYPDIESVKNEIYPLTSYFYAVTLSDNNNSNVKRLLDWVLSEQGQELVEKTGYAPL